MELYVRILAGSSVACLIAFSAYATLIACRAWAAEWRRQMRTYDDADEHADCVQEWHRCDGGGWPDRAKYEARVREAGRVFDREVWRD